MFCSTSCRVAEHRKGGVSADKAPKSPRVPFRKSEDVKIETIDWVPSPTRVVPEALKEAWSLPAPLKSVGKNEALTPFGMCPKHGGFYKSCHC